MARDSTAGSDGGDRTGDGKTGQLGRVIEGASQSSMNEVLDAWGPPPQRKQEGPVVTLKTKDSEQPEGGYEVEHRGEHGEKLLIKAGVEERKKVNENLDTNQIGMMALSGHPVAQAGEQMLKTPAAQNKEVRDGIKRDISNVLTDWFKEQFQNVTNAVVGFDKWVTYNLNSNKLKEAAEGIRKTVFGHHDGKHETAKLDGDMDNFRLKGVENPQDLAEYGANTAVGAARTLDGLALGLTPRGFVESSHAIAEGGREAIKNAGEFYGKRGIANLPADTANASKTAYDRIGQWSADRMQAEPGARGDVTGTAMAMMFFLAASNEFLNPKEAAKRMGVTEIELAGMTTEQLEAQGLKQYRVKLRDQGVPFPPEVPAEIHHALFESPSKFIQQRVDELKRLIPANSYNVTMSTAVVENAEGNRFILLATSEPRGYLRGGIKPKPGEMVIHGGQTHAEQDIVAFAKANDLKVVDIGATKGVCSPCHNAVKRTDANISTALKDQ